MHTVHIRSIQPKRTGARRLRAALALLLIAGPIMPSNVYASGIPTVDGAALAQDAIYYGQQLEKWTEQLAAAWQQVSLAKRQVDGLMGARNLGDILNNPLIRQNMPSDLRALLNDLDDVSSDIGSLADRIQKEEALSGDWERDSRIVAARVESISVRTKAIMEQTNKVMDARLDQIDQLQAQINLTQDPKAIAELQARLQIEQASIQTDQIRADVVHRQLQAEEALARRQARQLAKTSFSLSAIGAPLPGAD